MPEVSRRPARGVGGLLRRLPGGRSVLAPPSLMGLGAYPPLPVQQNRNADFNFGGKYGTLHSRTCSAHARTLRLGPPHLRCERICGHRLPAPP